MFIPGSIPTNTNLPLPTMNHHHHLHQQQQFLFDNLKDHRSNKFSLPMSRKTSSTPNFSLDPDLLRELNARYLHDINSTRSTGTNSNPDGNIPGFLLPPFLRAEHYHQHTHTHEHNLNILTPTNNSLLNGNSLLEKLSKSDNSLSSFLRTTTTTSNANNISLPPPPAAASVPPLFPSINSGPTPSTSNSSKETSSPPAKKCGKWCAAHVRISWMIYHHQQQRTKDKLSPSENKKEDDSSQSSTSFNSKLTDLSSNTKPILPPTPNELSLPLPSNFPNPLLPPPAFNYRSPFDFGVVNNGPFGRVPPSSTTAFGGLGSLFPPPPPPPPPSSIDRKSDINGSAAAAAAALGLDWSRFHRGIGPPLPSHENFSSKKLDEIPNSNNEKKRSSSVLNNDDDRRHSHHHLMPPPPPSHITSNNNHSSNRSRSRSPHPSLHPHHHHHHHHHSSSTLMNKTSSSSSSPPLSHSSSRKRTSPNIKSEPSKPSLHPPSAPIVPLPPNLGAFDPLTLSMIERQRLTAAYASLFAGVSQANNFFPGNVDPSTFRNHNNSSSSTPFPTLDPSAMTTALMQREHFLNSLRQQQELIEHERATHNSSTKSSSKSLTTKSEQISPKISTEETPRISPKVSTSPGSHSSTSSSSSSSKKLKHVKREHSSPSTNENLDMKPKEESNHESTT